jgi:septum formation protein
MATFAGSPQTAAPFRVPERSSVQMGVLVLASLIMLVSATGLTAHEIFHQPNTLKYVITVGGPAFVAMLALSSDPLRILTCLAIILTPINFVATLEGVQVTPQVALILLALPILAVSWRPRRSGWLGPAMVLIALCLLPAVLAGTQQLSYLIWIVITMAMGWLAFQLAGAPGGLRLVLISIGLAAFIQGVLSVYEYKTGHLINLYSGSGVQTASATSDFFNYGGKVRSAGTLSDPIALGNLLALTLPLMICLSVLESKVWIKLAVAAAGAVTTLGLIFTYSRMSWVGAAVGVPLAILVLPRGPRLKTAIAVVGVSFVIVSLGVSIGGSALVTRFESVFNPTNTQSSYSGTAKGDQQRERGWSASLKVFEHTPLGTGFGKVLPAVAKEGVDLPPSGDVQNFYLDLMTQAGLLGLLALVLLLGSTFRDMWAAFKRNRVFIAGATGAMAALLIGWTTDVSPRYTQVSGVIAALLGAICARAAANRAGARELDGVGEVRLVPGSVEPDTAPQEWPWERAVLAPQLSTAGARTTSAGAPTLVLAEGTSSFADAFARLELPFVTRLVADADYEPGGPIATVRRNALHRALEAARPTEPEAVLGVDRRLMLGMRTFPVPQTETEARETLAALSGQTHHVISAVAMVWGSAVRTAVSATAVTLRELTPEAIDYYVRTGEWVGRAGGYDIEGAGAGLVQKIDGDYQNLAGVPLEALLDVYPSLFDEH